MFIIYVLHSPTGEWDYYGTFRADSPNSITQLFNLIELLDGYCNEYEFFKGIKFFDHFTGSNINIFFVRDPYGVR